MSEPIPPPPPSVPYSSSAPTQQPPYAPNASAPYSSPQKPRRSGWFWASIFLGILVVGIGGFSALIYALVKSADSDSSSTFASSDSIAVIDISGVILDADKVDKEIRK